MLFRSESSGKQSLILCNPRASVELQPAPCTSKRFGAIPLGHFFTNAFPLKSSVYGSASMRSPQALYSVPLDKVAVIPRMTVVHYVQIHWQWNKSVRKRYLVAILRASTQAWNRLPVTGNALKLLYGTSNSMGADSAFSGRRS